MRRNLFAVVGIAVLTLAAAPGDAADCPALPAPYAGPLFDAMSQLHQRVSDGDVIDETRAGGVTRIALMGRFHPNGVSTLNRVLALAKEHPGLFVTGTTKVNWEYEEKGDLTKSFVDMILSEVGKYRHRFVGEIHYSHADKKDSETNPNGERHANPLLPETARLLNGLAGRGVHLITHWEFYNWARDWPRFDKLFADWPQQTFIIPHGGFGTSRQIDEVLTRRANVYVTLSHRQKLSNNFTDPKVGAILGEKATDDCGRLRPEWMTLMLTWQDRLLFAVDAKNDVAWSDYRNRVKGWRAILSQLPPDIARKIAFDNAQRLYGTAPQAR